MSNAMRWRDALDEINRLIGDDRPMTDPQETVSLLKDYIAGRESAYLASWRKRVSELTTEIETLRAERDNLESAFDRLKVAYGELPTGMVSDAGICVGMDLRDQPADLEAFLNHSAPQYAAAQGKPVVAQPVCSCGPMCMDLGDSCRYTAAQGKAQPAERNYLTALDANAEELGLYFCETCGSSDTSIRLHCHSCEPQLDPAVLEAGERLRTIIAETPSLAEQGYADLDTLLAQVQRKGE